MTAGQWCGVAILVGVSVVIIALNRAPRTNDQADWNRTAEDAANDVAETRRQREVAELEEWLQLRPRPKNVIPHQTRRTEEDQ